MKFKATFILLAVFILTSCTIHKRHYSKGFYIQFHPFQHANTHLKEENNFQNKLQNLELSEIHTNSDTTQINRVSTNKLCSNGITKKVRPALPSSKATLDTVPKSEQERIYVNRINRSENKTALNRNIALFTLIPLILMAMLLLVYDSPIIAIALVATFFVFAIAAIKWSIHNVTRRVTLRKLYQLNPSLLSPQQQKTGSASFLKRLLHFLIRCAIGFLSLFLLSRLFDYLASAQKEKYKLKVYAILLGISAPLTLVFLYFGWDIDIFLTLAGICIIIACISLALLIVFAIINGQIERENNYNDRVEEIKNENNSVPITEPTKPKEPSSTSPEELDLKLAWLKADEVVHKKNRQIINLIIALPIIFLLALSTEAGFFVALFLIDLLLLVVLFIIRLDKVDQRNTALRKMNKATSPSEN